MPSMIWSHTNEVGCALATCSGGPWDNWVNVVCQYCLGGNINTMTGAREKPYKSGDWASDCVSEKRCSTFGEKLCVPPCFGIWQQTSAQCASQPPQNINNVCGEQLTATSTTTTTTTTTTSTPPGESTTTAPEPQRCPAGWREGESWCYTTLTSKLTWQDASTACGDLASGAILVTVDTQDKFDLIKNVLTTLQAMNDTACFMNANNPTAAWIGANSLHSAMMFKWVDGTTVDSNDQAWRANQPLDNMGTEKCTWQSTAGAMSVDGWLTVSCASLTCAVCQAPKDDDECSANDTCSRDHNEVCVNTYGSFLCECAAGYSREKDGSPCSATELPKSTTEQPSSAANDEQTQTRSTEQTKVTTEEEAQTASKESWNITTEPEDASATTTTLQNTTVNAAPMSGSPSINIPSTSHENVCNILFYYLLVAWLLVLK